MYEVDHFLSSPQERMNCIHPEITALEKRLSPYLSIFYELEELHGESRFECPHRDSMIEGLTEHLSILQEEYPEEYSLEEDLDELRVLRLMESQLIAKGARLLHKI